MIILPLLTAMGVALRPRREAGGIALFGSLATLALGLLAARAFDFGRAADFQLGAATDLVPAIGLRLSLGVDSVALLLILLTVGIMPLAILGSWSAITDRAKEFYAWLLVLEGAMVGVFAARDLLVFYTCFEFTLVPMYFLIAVYGSANRARAATWFFLYTFTGSIITLVGLIYVGYAHWQATGRWTFDIAALTRTAAHLTATQQAWMLLALCCGFAVKVPLFPVHTWLPLAHTEAPTAGSVILAAVLLKLGTYGLYRFALPMAPLAIQEYSPLLAVLCIVGIVYGALVCWVQRDVKKLIAYSSVSHLGFCVLGLVALNLTGIGGSIMYMINHGLSTGALFLCIGMVYERFHTRSMDELGGLARRMPIWTAFTVFFVMSSVALPGLNGFVGEFLTVLGAFSSGQTLAGHRLPGELGPWYAAVAGTGMILGAIYLLYFTGHLVFGPLNYPHDRHLHGGHGHSHGHDHHAGPRLPRDLSAREIVVLSPLAVACVVLGVKPGLILDSVREPTLATIAAVYPEWDSGDGRTHAMNLDATDRSNGADGLSREPANGLAAALAEGAGR